MYVLAILLILPVNISAQSGISGRVIDKDSLPLTGATVLLLNHADSTYIAGTVSLEEVTIIGKRLPIKVEPGKMTINLSSALLSTDGNVLDVLSKLPGVIVQNDGTIILNGKSGANVLIDDKVTYLSGENLVNYLRSIPANSVDNIELISQPSSKYDAAGSSGIINIQKKKTKEQGMNLAASAALERGRYNKGNENFSLSFRQNKLSMYVDYSNYWFKNYVEMPLSGRYLDPETSQPLELRKDVVSDITWKTAGHYVKTGLDYDLSDKIALGAYLASTWHNMKKKEANTSDFFIHDSMQSDSTLTSLSTPDLSSTNLTGGINILYKFAKTGKWDASFDYQHFDQKDDHLLTSVFETHIRPVEKDTMSGKTTGDIKLYSGQTSMSYGLSEKFGIEAGIKTVFVHIDNDALYKNRIAGNWQENSYLSSNFGYKENINAGYVQLNAKWTPLFSTTMGLRLENTNTKSKYGSNARDTIFSKSYVQLFPTFMAQYQLPGNHGFSLMYGRRIVRPNYRNMNPFVEIKDPFLYEQGNTGLNPELIDNLEISWLFKKRYSFNAFYSHRKNPISLSFLVEDSRVLMMPLNLSGNNSFGIRAGLNNVQLFNWWTTHINGSLTYKKFDWVGFGKTFTNEVVTPMVHVNNQFALPCGWGAEAAGFYSGRMVEGQTTVKPIWTMALGLRKSLFNDKFSLYIYAHDIFHSKRPRVIVDSSYLYYTSKEKNDSRMIGVSLGYRFNRGREIKKSQHDRRIEESKRIGLTG